MTEEKPKRKPRAKKAKPSESQPIIQEIVKKQEKALSISEIQALPKAERKAALELHAKIGEDPKWAKVMLNVQV